MSWTLIICYKFALGRDFPLATWEGLYAVREAVSASFAVGRGVVQQWMRVQLA